MIYLPRSLSERDRKILYEKADGKCQVDGKKIEYAEMQVGHKKAASKGGLATLSNSVCLCYKHNNLQGTDSWSVFLKKIGKTPKREATKTIGKRRSYTCDARKPRPLICPGYLKASSKCIKVKMLDGKTCHHLHYSIK